jgi:hypothetical protein
MKATQWVRIATATGTALGVMALGSKHAEALYGPVYSASDTILNFAQKNNGASSFYISGQDTQGVSTGLVEPNGSDGVTVSLTTQGGSGYVKGFARCQNGTAKSAVYTGADVEAGGSIYHAWCSWLGPGWSRVGWGGMLNTLDTGTPPGGGWAADRLVCSGDGTGAQVWTNVASNFTSQYNASYSPTWTTSNTLISQIETVSAPTGLGASYGAFVEDHGDTIHLAA